jgi:hypothetical protein
VDSGILMEFTFQGQLMSVEVDECSGRPSTSKKTENIEKL